MKHTGKLIGVGVGPGDPELITLKALRVIKESDIIAVPGERPTESVAYKIVQEIYEGIDEKKIIGVSMPMIKDKELLRKSHIEAADSLAFYLKKGKQIAFLTLGDPTIYSTYIYLHQLVQECGYPTEIVSGITSFCAVAARMNMGLVEGAEELHVIPASYEIKEALKLPGTKVLMKAGKQMEEVKRFIKEGNISGKMIENCGMDTERIYQSLEDIPDKPSYFSLIITKNKDEKGE